jgi:ClpP class serine protease
LLIEQTLDPLNDIFLDAVRKNRGKQLNQEQTLSGKTFVATDAKDLGLIDDIMSMEDLLSQTIKKHTSTNLKFTL